MLIAQIYFVSSALEIAEKDPVDFYPEYGIELPLEDQSFIGNYYKNAEFNLVFLFNVINIMLIIAFLIIVFVPGAEKK